MACPFVRNCHIVFVWMVPKLGSRYFYLACSYIHICILSILLIAAVKTFLSKSTVI